MNPILYSQAQGRTLRDALEILCAFSVNANCADADLNSAIASLVPVVKALKVSSSICSNAEELLDYLSAG